MRTLIALSLMLCGALAEEGKTKLECPVIGIDLGTTYSCVGIWKGGQVEIIPNELGERITPSVVAFTDQERLIGAAAKNQMSNNPTRTIYDVKRLIGRKYTDKSVQYDKKYLPFDIIDKQGKPYIKVNTQTTDNRSFAPEEISAMVLTKMKNIAENYLGRTIENAVVTVPAYFDDSQRTSTKDAGSIAGFKNVRVLNEPTAAAVAYGLDKINDEKEKNILVFDLGGGTFDVSILTIDAGAFEVVATSGDTHLGGEDFDQRVLDHFMTVIKNKHKKDISQNKRSIAKLKIEVEKAKRILSTSHQVKIEIEDLFEGLDFEETLTRAKFEELNADLFKKTIEPLQIALEDSKFKKDQIDEIVLVGGSTRIPKVRKLVKEFFNGKEPNIGINPDEAVAYGAAVQGGILCGSQDGAINELVIVDVTPLSLGIEMHDGTMSVIIPRGTFVPTKKSQVFSTAADNQEMVTTAVYEGERPMCKDNHLLGKFDLKGIQRAKKGVPQIEVTFEIDSENIVQVTAQDLNEKVKGEITITNDKGRLTKDEIDQMLKDAETFKDQDKKDKENIDAKNSLDTYLVKIKNEVDDPEKLANTLNEEEKSKISDAILLHRKWYDDNKKAEKEEYEKHLKEAQDICDNIIKEAQKRKDESEANEDDKDENIDL